MNTDLLILKGVLLLKRNYNNPEAKEKLIADHKRYVANGWLSEEDLLQWVYNLQHKVEETDEEINARIERQLELDARDEYEQRMREREWYWHTHDEWYDYWRSR